MFSIFSGIQIALKDNFLLNSKEKHRCYFTELFFYSNLNFNSLLSAPRIKTVDTVKTATSFQVKLNANVDDYQIKVNYLSQKTFLYNIFCNTIFAPCFVNKKISISKNGLLVYKNGKKTQFYTKDLDTELNNIAHYFTSDLKKHSDAFTLKQLKKGI